MHAWYDPHYVGVFSREIRDNLSLPTELLHFVIVSIGGVRRWSAMRGMPPLLVVELIPSAYAESCLPATALSVH